MLLGYSPEIVLLLGWTPDNGALKRGIEAAMSHADAQAEDEE